MLLVQSTGFTETAFEVIGMVMLQLPKAAIEAPVNTKPRPLGPPGPATTAPDPQPARLPAPIEALLSISSGQRLLGDARVASSVRATPVSGSVLSLTMVTVAEPTCPTDSGLGEKLLLTRIGELTVIAVLTAALSGRPRVLPMSPVLMVLAPAAVTAPGPSTPRTVAEIEQLPPAAMVPPDNEIVPEPATAVTVAPVQVVVAAGVATTRLAGSVSVNVVRGTLVDALALLLMVMVTEVVLPCASGFVPTPKALVAVSGDNGVTMSEKDGLPPGTLTAGVLLKLASTSVLL